MSRVRNKHLIDLFHELVDVLCRNKMIIDECDSVPLDKCVHGPLNDLDVDPNMLRQLKYIDPAPLLTECVPYLPL